MDQDKELRLRISTEFNSCDSSVARKIAARPKTPRYVRKKHLSVEIAPRQKPVVHEKPAKQKPARQKSVRRENEKPARQKQPRQKPVVREKPAKQKPAKQKHVREVIYLCHICDKKYKTKNGVLRHMKKCCAKNSGD